MSFSPSFIPVTDKRIKIRYKHSLTSILYFIVPYTSDCPICFGFFTDPVTLRCGHMFCSSCIRDNTATTNSLSSKLCPLCSVRYYDYFPIKFIFAEKIENYVLLRRVKNMEWSSNIKDWVKFPFNVVYHENNMISSEYDLKIKSSYNTNTKKNVNYYQRNNSKPAKKVNTRFNLITPTFSNRHSVFYQQNEGQLLFLGSESMKALKDLPLYVYFKIRKRFKGRNMGRLRHLEWDREIEIVEF